VIRAPASEVAVSLCLRRPSALGYVGERRFSARRCRVGPRVSRVRFSATSSRRRRRRRQGIRSPRALPRLDGDSLRRHQRARGGGASCVEPLYRSPSAICHPCWEVCLPAFCSVDAEMTLDLGVAWREEQTRSSCGGFCRRRRVWFQGRRNLGRVPDRWIFSVAFISSMMASVYCGSSQSHVAMELLPT
jgi:hypothetical protein